MQWRDRNGGLEYIFKLEGVGTERALCVVDLKSVKIFVIDQEGLELRYRSFLHGAGKSSDCCGGCGSWRVLDRLRAVGYWDLNKCSIWS